MDFRAAKRVIVIVPTLEAGSEIELDWKVQAKGLDELPTYLVTERSNGIELSDEELLRIPKLLRCEPWREVNDLIAGVLPAWEETPSEPVPPRPEVAPAPPTPPAPDPAPAAPRPEVAPWLRNAWQQVNTWPGRVLTVFAAVALFSVLAALPGFFAERGQPAVPSLQPLPMIPEAGLPENVSNGVAEVHQPAHRRWDFVTRKWIRTDPESADVLVTLETVDFNNSRITLDWTVENRRKVPIRMALVAENITITDSAQTQYLIEAGRSVPPGQLVVDPGERAVASVMVPQAVRSNAITLQITLRQQPFGETTWIVNVPQMTR